MSKLTEKQKRFIDFYIETGNASEAARLAGYSKKTAGQIGDENLKKLKTFIDERQEALDNSRLADMQEINEFWSEIVRGDEKHGFIEVKDRLKASELRAKVLGAFVARVEVTKVESDWFK